nr:MJ0042-type zinc finger domain-containing protein [Pseudomonas aeruginosa]
MGAANGAVRCGTCLKVFNALQHQVGGAPRANAPSAAEAKPVAAPPPAPSVAAATSAAPRQHARATKPCGSMTTSTWTASTSTRNWPSSTNSS